MKRILAIDTSSDNCSIAVCDGHQVICSSISSPRQHSQKLLPLIDELLVSRRMTLSDLDAIAFGCGPGSFTGIRICLATVQGLAYSLDIPVVPISTLRTMAEGAIRQGLAKVGDSVLIAIDARMKEVYWVLYQVAVNKNDGSIRLSTVTDESVSAPASVAVSPAVSSAQAEQLVVFGSGGLYDEIASIPVRQRICQFEPQAIDILHLASIELEQQAPRGAEEAQPVYLRDSVAWKKRQRIRH